MDEISEQKIMEIFRRADDARFFLKVQGFLSESEEEKVLRRMKRKFQKYGFIIRKKEE